jgi:hypothetical protein
MAKLSSFLGGFPGPTGPTGPASTIPGPTGPIDIRALKLSKLKKN